MDALLLLMFLGALVAAWVSRGRYERGTVARRVATGIAIVLSLIGLTGVGFLVLLMVAVNSWANSK